VRWVALRARGADWSWLTPKEAAELAREWKERYGAHWYLQFTTGNWLTATDRKAAAGRDRLNAEIKQTVWKHVPRLEQTIRTGDQGLIGSSEPDARVWFVRRRTNGAL